MRDWNNNIVMMKSMDFAIRCIKLAKYLREKYKEFELASQIVRSGTSIGANIKEAQRGQSRADFRTKMNISLKEANETQYWLELLHRSDYLEDKEYKSIYNDCTELCRLLMSIVRATDKNKQNNSF